MKKNFTQPTYAVDNVQQLPDLVKNQAVPSKQVFDKVGLDGKNYLTNVLLAQLSSIDGSYCIGHQSAHVTSDNLGDVIEELYNIIISTTQGAIPDGSITKPKLSPQLTAEVDGKANLAGGNVFAGNQTINGNMHTTGNLTVGGTLSVPIPTATMSSGFSSGWSGSIVCKKNVNNDITLEFHALLKSSAFISGENIGTLPVGFRPGTAKIIYFQPLSGGGGICWEQCTLEIQTSGVMWLYYQGGTVGRSIAGLTVTYAAP